ncbi:MAG: hypothetical protein L3J65_08970 [Robiginitomaculum sp.]|nr:hypothetical protein [Robiginitomaculum sp.]
MSKFPANQQITASPDTLRHLKTGDILNINPAVDEADRNSMRFTVLGADIVHNNNRNTALEENKHNIPMMLTLTTNYPFGRRTGDTPLRYVVYAALTP